MLSILSPIYSTNTLLFCIIVCIVRINSAELKYSFVENHRIDIPYCNDTTNVFCVGTSVPSYSYARGGMVVSHSRGLSFMDNSVFPPRVTKEYYSYCNSLLNMGEDKNGHIYFAHLSTPSCTCEGPEPCIPPLPLITSPDSLAGYVPSLEGIGARHISTIETEIEATVTVAVDAAGTNFGCSEYTNKEQANGTIVLVTRGNCAFNDKAANALKAGAVGLLVRNTEDSLEILRVTNSPPFPMVMIRQTEGQAIVGSINNGVPVVMKIGANIGDSSKPGNKSQGILSFSENAAFSGDGGFIDGTPNTNFFKTIVSYVVDFERNHLWVSEPNLVTGLLQIYDVTNSLNPVLLFNQSLSGSTLSPVTSRLGTGRFVTLQGKRLFIQGWYNFGVVVVIDVTDLNNMFIVKQYEYGPVLNVVPTINGPSEIFYATTNDLTKHDEIAMFNISADSLSPVATFPPPPQVSNTTEANWIVAIKSRLYTAYGSDGLFMYDNSNPLSPILVGHLKTVNESGSFVTGIQSVSIINDTFIQVRNYDPPTHSIIWYSIVPVVEPTTGTTSSPTTTDGPTISTTGPTVGPTTAGPTTTGPTTAGPTITGPTTSGTNSGEPSTTTSAASCVVVPLFLLSIVASFIF